MPPRYTYWTIILDGKPTAFRAHERDELLPTLRQLQARHPDAVMLWFARGRLWQSQDEERAFAQAHRARGERRDRAWRPGGEHRDPRDRFKVPRDEKRRRFAAKRRDERNAPSEQPRTTDGKPWPDRSKPRRRDRTPGSGWPHDEQRPPGTGGEPNRFRPKGRDGQRSEKAAWRPRGPRGSPPRGRPDPKRGGARGGGRGSGGRGGSR